MNISVPVIMMALGFIAHTVAIVWWAATVTTTLRILGHDFREVKTMLVLHQEISYSKSDAARDFAVRDARIDAALNKIDEISRLS